ncbi:hypothetical protein [Oenococcus oeni]|uniref:hypothetical protein n=1 Tax=Oenococcus oeni TaxID=1247 RepID=UPI000277B90E|nr:hypothetical protein [Oenococcus oeni]EJO02679.1 hypothetical protein AWRIB418_577 [Oenococcus oeni AWRIB418]OIM23340.1 hypothetical protein ATX62_09170 [Oenococcus oeni]OIM39017.1 hypothetical protein ATX72_06860 [Oenococcus oeni]QGR01752.1 hypothetical protein E4R25_07935 [Oenococcus oeni]TEU23272.1 hypothetical protein E2147_05620 [Oenococcus oeni]
MTVYIDHYGKDHGSIAGMLVIRDIASNAYVEKAFKTHIKLTPQSAKAKVFLNLSEADFFMECHSMANYRYSIKVND